MGDKKGKEKEGKSRTGTLMGYIAKDDKPVGEYRILHLIETPVQRIAVVEQNDKVLIYGNGYVMIGTTEDEGNFAEALVHIPMAIAQNRKSILLIGAGGGVTTREMLKYSEVEEITAIDADEMMMGFGKNLEQLVTFNEGALNNSKVTTVIQDGRAFVENNQQKWDVIILDVPEPSKDCPELSRLFSLEFFRLLKQQLEPEGVLGVACSLFSEMPKYCWSVVATLEAAGFYVLPYHYNVPEEEEDWGFCVATSKPLSPSDVCITIPSHFLTAKRLKDMFHIPSKYWRKWDKRKIQTDSNQVLAKIHGRL